METSSSNSENEAGKKHTDLEAKLKELDKLHKIGQHPNQLNKGVNFTSAKLSAGAGDFSFQGNYGSDFTFEVGNVYDQREIDIYLNKPAKMGSQTIYKPKTNGNGVERMYFQTIKLGFFRRGQKLIRIEGKDGVERILQPEEVVKVTDEHGDSHMEFIPCQTYGQKTIDQYLEIAHTMGEGNVALFQTRANQGNGHYYLFSKLGTNGDAVYVFLSMHDKSDVTTPPKNVEDTVHGVEQKTVAQ